MDVNQSGFAGSIPHHYDTGLGPVLFADHAAEMARRVVESGARKVLEIAAGTGIVSRQLLDRLPADAQLTSSDLSASMLDVARTKFRLNERVDFQIADGSALPFDSDAFDAVVCQFGVMFFPDKEKAYREAHRVLRSGGSYFFSVWDSFRYNRYARLAHEIIASSFPEDPPQFYRTPYGQYALDPIREDLIDAGFHNLDIFVLSSIKEVGNLADFARGLVFGNPVIDQIRARGSLAPEALAASVAEGLESEFGANPCRLPMQIMIFHARCA
jgi:SAM-dependent methyltransferase